MKPKIDLSEFLVGGAISRPWVGTPYSLLGRWLLMGVSGSSRIRKIPEEIRARLEELGLLVRVESTGYVETTDERFCKMLMSAEAKEVAAQLHTLLALEDA